MTPDERVHLRRAIDRFSRTVKPLSRVQMLWLLDQADEAERLREAIETHRADVTGYEDASGNLRARGWEFDLWSVLDDA